MEEWFKEKITDPLLNDKLLIEWCFQQYFSHITATVHVIDVFPGNHYFYTGTLKCLAQGHSHEKPRGSSADRTEDSWITSQTIYH